MVIDFCAKTEFEKIPGLGQFIHLLHTMKNFHQQKVKVIDVPLSIFLLEDVLILTVRSIKGTRLLYSIER